jgi:hypothetical protein
MVMAAQSSGESFLVDHFGMIPAVITTLGQAAPISCKNWRQFDVIYSF